MGSGFEDIGRGSSAGCRRPGLSTAVPLPPGLTPTPSTRGVRIWFCPGVHFQTRTIRPIEGVLAMRVERFVLSVSCVVCLSLAGEVAAQCSVQVPASTIPITQNFASGTQWTMSLGDTPCEGLIPLFANFKPRNGVSRTVLYRASISQIHVPYSPGSPRFRDIGISTSGLGANAIPLSAAECPGGTRYDGNKICVTVEDRGFAWKYGSSSARGQVLSIFMASQLGNYTYVNMWNFQDDGTIEVRTGLTGRLQIVDSG